MYRAFLSCLSNKILSSTVRAGRSPDICNPAPFKLTVRFHDAFRERGKGLENLHMYRLTKLQLLRLRLKMMERKGKKKDANKLKQEIRNIEADLRAYPKKHEN